MRVWIRELNPYQGHWSIKKGKVRGEEEKEGGGGDRKDMCNVAIAPWEGRAKTMVQVPSKPLN